MENWIEPDPTSTQLEQDALWGSAWLNLGVSDRDHGDPKEALPAFITATILMPEDLETWQNAMVMAYLLEEDHVLTDLVVSGRRMAGDELIDWMVEVTRHGDGSFPRAAFIARMDAILAEPAASATGARSPAARRGRCRRGDRRQRCAGRRQRGGRGGAA